MRAPKKARSPKKPAERQAPLPRKIEPLRPRRGEPEGNLEQRELYFQKRRGST
jgi:hypothetical protein